MGAGSNGQGSSGGNGGKGGNPAGKQAIWIWRSEHYNAQGQLLHRLQRRTRVRRNAEVHRKRIRRNAIAGPHPYGGNKRSRTITHARGVKLHKKSQERWGPDAR
jgi:hypothetical protein